MRPRWHRWIPALAMGTAIVVAVSAVRAQPQADRPARIEERLHQSGGTVSAEARDADGRSLGTLPCFRPPWASLMAVDAATGEFVWRVPLGVNDNMPEGKQHVGSPGYGGPMVTAGGLVFIGATRDRNKSLA